KLSKGESRPVIKLKNNKNLTGNCMYTIEGIVTSANYVRPAIVKGEPLLYCLKTKGERILYDEHFPAEVSAKSCGFKTEVDLCESEGQGSRTIKIGAVDVTGRSSEKEVKVTLDREGPAIAIDSVSEAAGKIRVVGTVYDNYGIRDVSFNGENRFTSKPNITKKEWSFDVTLAASKIAIKATDKAGNITGYTFPETQEDAALTGEVLLAQNGASDSDGSEGCTFNRDGLNIGKNCPNIVKEMVDPLSELSTIPINVFRNFIKRAIDLREDLSKQSSLIKIIPEGRFFKFRRSVATFEKSLKVMITVYNVNQFSDLTLYNNDKEIKCPGKDKFKKGNHSYTFSCSVPVTTGIDNKIKLIAYTKQKDEQKQSSINVQRLERARPDMLLRIAVIAADKNGKSIGNITDKYKKIYDALESSDRFKIINIDDKKETISNKYKIRDGIFINPDNAKNAAIEAKVDMFLLLTINRIGITTKFIETGCFVTTTPKDSINCDVSPKQTILVPNTYTFKSNEKEIVQYLEDNFPVVEGKVKTLTHNESFEVDKGKDPWKIRDGTRLYLFNKASAIKQLLCNNVNFAFIGGCENIVQTDEDYYGKAVVTDVRDTTSEAKVIYITPGNKVTSDDIVITK
ncbi:MAG: hypothetical protein HQL03_10430, partial [Nitrospirae bacterium]|nr:hypothetical protein [Nitrospirota bacterium]